MERVLCVEDSWDCECIERESIAVKITGGPLFQNSTHTISHQDYDFISEKLMLQRQPEHSSKLHCETYFKFIFKTYSPTLCE